HVLRLRLGGTVLRPAGAPLRLLLSRALSWPDPPVVNVTMSSCSINPESRCSVLRSSSLQTAPPPSFWSSASVPHREDRPLRGVGRGLSTSAGDAVPVTAPPRCNRYSAHEGPVLTRWSLPDLMSLSATRAADVQ